MKGIKFYVQVVPTARQLRHRTKWLPLLVSKGRIFGAAMDPPGFSLLGCMVSPGGSFDDFELFSREALLAKYPQHENIICRLSRSER